MIRALKSLFEMPVEESPEQLEHRLRLATAAMLIETAQADFGEDKREAAVMTELLCRSLSLPAAEVGQLLEEAQARVEQATSLYEFTRLINDHYSPQRKVQIVEAMWRVAYADGNLDKYEEALIRRVAELTYVPHGEYIRCKLTAREDAQAT